MANHRVFADHALTKQEREKRYRELHPDTSRAARRRQNLKKLFRLTPEQYNAMLVAQSGVCAACKMPETKVIAGRVQSLSVDHDRACCPDRRSCGDCIRGLLCARCNQMLGMARDDTEVLAAAMSYLTPNLIGAL